MTAKLTKAQLFVLADLAGVKIASPYQLGMPVTVFRKLGVKGLVKAIAGSGQYSTWTITPAGRAALEPPHE